MARSTHKPVLARHALAIVITALCVLALLPSSSLGWANSFADLAQRVTAPIVHPISWVARKLSPPQRRQQRRDLDELASLYDYERAQRLRLLDDNKQLRTLLDELSRGTAVQPDTPVDQLVRSVIEPSSRLMRVRGGTGDGIAAGAVASTAGVQLVGRVRRAEPSASWVQPITARDAEPIRCVAILDQAAEQQLACLLEPTGSGTLQGQVEASEPVPPPAIAAELALGQTVRLSDDLWPDHAQMLVVGTIERITPHPDQPLRQVITVRPTIDLGRLGEVVFRVEQGDAP